MSRSSTMNRLRDWARKLKREIVALWFCARRPDTPVIAKITAAAVVAYAFSPIDLVPDFIPVLGLLDDLVLLPAGIWLALRLIPREVLDQCREDAARWLDRSLSKPRSIAGALFIVTLWIVFLWLGWHWTQSWVAH